MTPLMIVGIAGLFGGLIGSRFISERSLALLSSDEKVALLDGFSRHRSFASLPLVLVVFLFFGLLYIPRRFVFAGFLAIAALFAGYIAWQHYYVHRRMRELSISEPFIRAQRRAQWCSRAGWFIFFIAMAVSLWRD